MKEVEGFGEIKWKNGFLKGKVEKEKYFENEDNNLRTALDFVRDFVYNFYSQDKMMMGILEKADEILKSQTFKVSRSKQNVKLVPENVSELNLRIHNKARKIAPEVLDKIEKRL
jgi:hypothetical protein